MPSDPIPDVMGSGLWLPQNNPGPQPLIYHAVGDYYDESTIDYTLAGLLWPTEFSGTQSIEVTVSNFGHDTTDYTAIECRRTDTDAFGAGLRFANYKYVDLVDGPLWQWYVEVADGVGGTPYSYNPPDPDFPAGWFFWPYGDTFTQRLESDTDGAFRVFINDVLLFADSYASPAGPSMMGLWGDRTADPDGPRFTDIGLRSSDLEVVWAPPPPSVVGDRYSIDLCVDWMRVAECVDGVFDGVIRNLAAGEWRLTGAVDALAVDAGYELSDINTIRVVRDALVVFAGYVSPVASGVGGLEIVKDANGDMFTLTGSDAWSVLASRSAYPTPGTEQPWADPWDVRTGLASTAAAGYISANLGSGAMASRQIPGVTVIDGFAGLSGSWSARLQPLDQLIARVCRDGQIVCRLVVDFDGDVQVTLRSPLDRTATVVLSDQGDLSKIQTVQVPRSATFVIAGGQGALTARTFATAGTATGAARREVFSDQSSLSTSTEVQQSATTTLALAAATLTVRAEVTDTAALRLQYLVHYDIGDTIAAELDDVRYPAVIESVTVHIDPNRAVIRPVLGDASPDLVTGLIRDVAGLASRFDTQIA